MLRSKFFCLVLIVSMLAFNCSNEKEREKHKRQDLTLLTLIGVAYFSNPCNLATSPLLDSARSSGSMAGFGSIKGRILTLGGIDVISALVVAESNAGVGTTFWSTHSSIQRDGTFLISGINPATVKLAVEPLDSRVFNRVDTHVACFMKPAQFTAGWLGPAGSLVTTRATGRDYIVDAGSNLDVGVIRLRE